MRITGNEAIIGEYGLEPFTLNVLDKRQTTNFNGMWTSLRETHMRELPAITFSEIQHEKAVAESFVHLLNHI